MFFQTDQMLAVYELGYELARQAERNKKSACSLCSSTEDVKKYHASFVCDKCYFQISTQDEE